MNSSRFRQLTIPCLLAALLLAPGCGDGQAQPADTLGDAAGLEAQSEVTPEGCVGRGEAWATSTCLSPRQAPDYYIQQSLRYFDTLDLEADPASVPNYSELVARWEWPPWLKLTGFGRTPMVKIAELLKSYDPSTVPTRDCRAFQVQPFGRCRVVFAYPGGTCPIYEEFSFNDQGQITFIEAWSDAPTLLPTPDPADPWAEGPGVNRLSTRVPGLGNATGLLDLDAPWMTAAAAMDPDLADFVTRAKNFWPTWFAEYLAAGDDLYIQGCGW